MHDLISRNYKDVRSPFTKTAAQERWTIPKDHMQIGYMGKILKSKLHTCCCCHRQFVDRYDIFISKLIRDIFLRSWIFKYKKSHFLCNFTDLWHFNWGVVPMAGNGCISGDAPNLALYRVHQIPPFFCYLHMNLNNRIKIGIIIMTSFASGSGTVYRFGRILVLL